jgi:C1A family cysteine protease
MIIKKLVVIFCLPLLVLLPLPKQYFSKTIPQVKTGTISPSRKVASGYCGGVNLGIAIPDTSYYRATSTDTLAPALLLEMPAAGNQGSQGSCAAWATVYGAGSFHVHLTTGRPYSDTGNLSPRFIYNQITKGNCNCTSVLDNLYLLKNQGACSLNTMPYDPNDCSVQPDSLQRYQAENFKIDGWQRIDVHNLTLLKRAVNDNKPIIFSIATDEGFKKLKEPFIWKLKSGAAAEAHSMLISGYDDEKNAFRVMNSWGRKWADQGFAWIDYNFFLANVLDGAHVIY